jgi:hypothetical protein
MIERVMLLDAVLDDSTCTWLGPARDKRRHFIRHLESRLDARECPHLTFGDGPGKTVRYFPDKLPIGVLPGLDHHAFVYLVTSPSPMEFRLFKALCRQWLEDPLQHAVDGWLDHPCRRARSRSWPR